MILWESLGVLWSYCGMGGPIVGDLVIFVYTHGHMGRGLDPEEN